MRFGVNRKGEHGQKWLYAVPSAAVAASLGFILVLAAVTSHGGSAPGGSTQMQILQRRDGISGAAGGQPSRFWRAGRRGGGGGRKDCPAGCEKHGNCDRDLGACRCPFGWTGSACEAKTLAACRLADVPDAPMRCPLVRHDRAEAFQISCECHRQCVAYREALGDEQDWHGLIDPEQENVLCFERSDLLPEHQLSALPPPEQQDVAYFKGSKKETQKPVSREDVTKRWRFWTGEQQPPTEVLPPAQCPNACSAAGVCLTIQDPAPAEGEPLPPLRGPLCHCYVGHVGEDCSGRADRGTALDRCPRDCGGVGRCVDGFCHCPAGVWGADCGRTQAVAWLEQRPPQDRFRIYIYELPHTLVKAMAMEVGNPDLIYAAFLHFLHGIRGDWSVRTQNPNEASLFLAPAQSYFYSSNTGLPIGHAAAVADWCRTRFPFWNASGGADHFFWFPGDKGFMRPAQVLPEYWGFKDPLGEEFARMDAPIKLVHFCWSGPHQPSSREPGVNLLAKYGGDGQPAGYDFSPSKDVCAVPFHYPSSWGDAKHTYSEVEDTPELRGDPKHSPLGERSTLMYFVGSLRIDENGVDGDPEYSGGGRQALFKHHPNTPGFRIYHRGITLDPPLRGMPVEMRDAKFCFCPSGHGFGMRIMESVGFGCIPVLAQDYIQSYLEEVLPYERFSIRVAQCDIPDLHNILNSIPPAEVARLQWGLVDWHRAFVWDLGPLHESVQGQNPPPTPYGLAYNWTVAALEHAWVGVQSRQRLQPSSHLQAWRLATGQAVAEAAEAAEAAGGSDSAAAVP